MGWVVAVATSSAFASSAALADYEHTVWTARQGLAAEVFSITQVPNGMLRIRTTVGNQIFDGVTFHAPVKDEAGGPFLDYADLVGQLSPTGAVYYIHPQTLRLMRRWQGRTEAVEDKDDVGWWTRFVFDPQGIGWYYKEGGVFRLEGLRVEALDDSWGIPKGMRASYRPVIDTEGTVWFANPDRLYRLPRGARVFQRVDVAGCDRPAISPDGSLWCSSPTGLTVITLRDGVPVHRRVLSTQPSGPMLFDGRGGIWLATSTGLAHAADWRSLLAPGGMATLVSGALTREQGLNSLSINMIFEDAEGNVWIGTSSSLERLRLPRLRRADFPAYQVGVNVRPDPQGGFWIGPEKGPLAHLDNGRVTAVPGIRDVATVQPAPGGRLWVATRDALWRKDPGAPFVPVPAPGLSLRGRIHQIAEDESGAVWLQSGYHLLRLWHGTLSAEDSSQSPPSYGRYVMVHDDQDQLWFISNVRRGPFVRRHGVLRELHSKAYAETMAQGWVGYARGSRMWVGGRTGVGVFEQDEFHPIRSKGNVLSAITGIVETAQGDLWLYGLNTLFRIPADMLEAGLRGETIEPEVIDGRDGLKGTNDRLYAPTLTQDASGRLFVSTNEGVFWIDPQTRPPVRKPPVAMIQSVSSDGQVTPLPSGVQLAATPSHTQFTYAAAALSVDDRVRFRYRIEGVDAHWQEAGTRRTAYYTQLPPGQHRFEVMASNDTGEWPQEATSLAFVVLPAWYQTWWCRALVALTAVGGLWWMHRLRVGVLRLREEARMRAVLAERARIARDLHDTLLQSMQGVILDFQSVASALPEHDTTRRSIETRLDRADQLLGEARDRVGDLRRNDAQAVTLRESFEAATAHLLGSVDVTVVESGRPKPLRPQIRDRIYLIGREALLNAVTHGEGAPITVQLEFMPQRFVLKVKDEGPGIDPDILAAGARPGHFGLQGMRERAAQMGGSVSISRPTAGGCLVELRVPASQAYERATTLRA